MYSTATCACGSVEIRANERPIVCAVCYCQDCQDGWRQLEALPDAQSAREADGGMAYQLYRKDRVHCVAGEQHLRAYKLREKSATNRVVATCCKTPMLINFDDSKHWVSICRPRFKGAQAPLEMRVCTKSREADDQPSDVPSHPGYPLRFIGKLLAARLAMLLGP
ncbi:MAG: hypothetical protein V4463_12960 [Pseudomonadota bacterium]